MKSLKFTSELSEQILQGTKVTTWRLFDDKDLQNGDLLEFFNKETGVRFGKAVIKNIQIKTLETLNESDWVGHERYSSEKEMYDTYKSYYGDKVEPASEVKIIDFHFSEE